MGNAKAICCLPLSGDTPQALEDLAFEKKKTFLRVFLEGWSFGVKNGKFGGEFSMIYCSER